MTKIPVSELEFLKISNNHLEFDRKLTTLGWKTQQLKAYAQIVGSAWFKLAEEHLSEAEKIAAINCSRASYSRAYYAAYNASKAVRYLTSGFVSLKGDDHARATELPRDFPDIEIWAEKIGKLYEHRLRSDYDNWQTTQSEHTLTPEVAVDHARSFIAAAKEYLKLKLEIEL